MPYLACILSPVLFLLHTADIFNNVSAGTRVQKSISDVTVDYRNSLSSSSMLFNSEAWHKLTKAEIELLETFDVILLGGILKAPKSTPKEMLYLELGLVPYKEIIQKKRLSYLQFIFKESNDSIIYKYFESQRRNRTAT